MKQVRDTAKDLIDKSEDSMPELQSQLIDLTTSWEKVSSLLIDLLQSYYKFIRLSCFTWMVPVSQWLVFKIVNGLLHELVLYR